jgi:hypothetical protein
MMMAVGEASGGRDFLAEVAAERDGLEASVTIVELFEGEESCIRRAVVDADHLPVVADPVQHGAQPVRQPIQAALLVEHRHDDRKLAARFAAQHRANIGVLGHRQQLHLARGP